MVGNMSSMPTSMQHPQDTLRRRMNERGEYVSLYTYVAGSSSTHALGVPVPDMPPLNTKSGGTVSPLAPVGPPLPSASMPPGGQPPPSATMPQPSGHGIPPMGGT